MQDAPPNLRSTMRAQRTPKLARSRSTKDDYCSAVALPIVGYVIGASEDPHMSREVIVAKYTWIVVVSVLGPSTARTEIIQ
jgi:hypothetical protein